MHPAVALDEHNCDLGGRMGEMSEFGGAGGNADEEGGAEGADGRTSIKGREDWCVCVEVEVKVEVESCGWRWRWRRSWRRWRLEASFDEQTTVRSEVCVCVDVRVCGR